MTKDQAFIGQKVIAKNLPEALKHYEGRALTIKYIDADYWADVVETFYRSSLSDLEPAPFQVGDVVEFQGNERMVIEVLGESCLLSDMSWIHLTRNKDWKVISPISDIKIIDGVTYKRV